MNLAAVAERAVGAAQDAASFALLWMGDGLGLAVDLGGTLHRGAAGGAGEIGYLPVPRAAEDLVADAEDLTDLLGGDAVADCSAPRTPTSRERSTGSATTRRPRRPRRARRARRHPGARRARPRAVVLGGPTGVAGGDRGSPSCVAERLSGIDSRRLEHSSRWRPAVRASGIAGPSVLGGARRMLVGRIHDRLVADISTPTP